MLCNLDENRLSLLLTAAVEAGQSFAQKISEQQRITVKTSLADVVTEADKAAEALVRRHVSELFPEDVVLGEEGTAPGSDAATRAVSELADAEHLWIVDPLDGTTNFVQRMPLSVVSLGYAERGELKMGAVYDPYHDELFYAVKGHGAYLASGEDAKRYQRGEDHSDSIRIGEAHYLFGRPIAASTVEEPRRAILASGFPPRVENRSETLIKSMQLIAEAKNVRAFGAAALHLAYVAAGRIDGFWEFDLNVWDVAAGALLVEEAGGVALDLSLEKFHLGTRNIVACGRIELAKRIGSTFLP